MTQTDRLRAMLDERGVEWMAIAWNAKRETFYRTVNGVGFCADEYVDGLIIHTDGPISPEQAIAATLGSPTLNANLEQALSFMRIWISDDAHLGESELSAAFEKAEGLRKLDSIEIAIADTLGHSLNNQSMSERGTCHVDTVPMGTNADDGDVDVCSNCRVPIDDSAYFCSNCGARIVDKRELMRGDAE